MSVTVFINYGNFAFAWSFNFVCGYFECDFSGCFSVDVGNPVGLFRGSTYVAVFSRVFQAVSDFKITPPAGTAMSPSVVDVNTGSGVVGLSQLVKAMKATSSEAAIKEIRFIVDKF